MSMYSKETLTEILDQMLSRELSYSASFASETNIKDAMKRVLGMLIKKCILKRYDSLVLDEDLNVHITVVDAENTVFDIILYYGR
jgi:hypothetical protein